MEGNMVMTEQGSDVEQHGHEGRRPTSRPRRTRIVLAATLAGVLVLGGGGGVAYAQWNSGQNEQLAAARSAYSAADAANVEARATASAAVEASEGRVADDQVRADLEELLSARGPVQQNGSRAEKTAALEAATDETEAETAAIVAATTAVVEAQTAWELEQATAGYEAASAELAAALDAGGGVLAGSEGKVADNAVRQALTDAIDAGNALRSAQPAGDVDALTAGAAQLAGATAALSAATSATADAQAAWQAEQDRIAAEQAAAAEAAAAKAAAAKSSPGKKSNSSSSGSSKGSGGGSSAGSGGGGSSAGSGGGGSSAGSGGGSSTKPPRIGSNPGSNFGTGTAPACTTPSCGITF
jgi:hypothetical protein